MSSCWLRRREATWRRRVRRWTAAQTKTAKRCAADGDAAHSAPPCARAHESRAALCAQNGWAPLSWAAEKGFLGVVQLLVDRGADKETKDGVRSAEPAAAPRRARPSRVRAAACSCRGPAAARRRGGRWLFRARACIRRGSDGPISVCRRRARAVQRARADAALRAAARSAAPRRAAPRRVSACARAQRTRACFPRAQ
jgi:hypothetical protein